VLKQAELCELEEKLQDLDEVNHGEQVETRNPDEAVSFQTSREYQGRARGVLLENIQNKLKDYGNVVPVQGRLILRKANHAIESLLVAQYTMERFPKARKRNIRSYKRWLNGKQVLISYEMCFLEDSEDLITVSEEEEYTVLEDIADKVLGRKLASKVVSSR
jgi:hypothetical protein